MDTIGKLFLLIGGVLVLLGGIMVLGGKLFGLGRLPGDIFFQKGNFSFYFPLATCIILSILLTIIMSFFRR
ncbi:DUF2905 domain-containing protein [Pelotomaculum propionicicum]|uniref:DUF2905 domain-containing protein n=1 Tax=Pelotomaculum propionicicum TaxID=258475 RepID=A0A4Y7RII9_9FIRM|nr:DUF2905 domain-containing protein [Pelotomaculum propionicicum]NLI14158.1 DUF2905 domain-containing protein [Peptococcaceae bacterium]TEB08805.1 hypothetical protein Pmgp_03607 [Pelotomaculum propionicicum]